MHYKDYIIGGVLCTLIYSFAVPKTAYAAYFGDKQLSGGDQAIMTLVTIGTFAFVLFVAGLLLYVFLSSLGFDKQIDNVLNKIKSFFSSSNQNTYNTENRFATSSSINDNTNHTIKSDYSSSNNNVDSSKNNSQKTWTKQEIEFVYKNVDLIGAQLYADLIHKSERADSLVSYAAGCYNNLNDADPRMDEPSKKGITWRGAFIMIGPQMIYNMCYPCIHNPDINKFLSENQINFYANKLSEVKSKFPDYDFTNYENY